MPESDDNPRAARRLREFGRRRAPDEIDELQNRANAQEPTSATQLAPGSIWGPATSAEAPSPVVDEPAPADPPNPKHRRRAGERPPDPDAVDIDADTSHDWWAKRDDLDQVVSPKKRGAAARAQRAAREAFAPPGAASVPSGGHPHSDPPSADVAGSQGKWDPSNVYSWGAATSADPPPRVNDSARDTSSWDDGWDSPHEDASVHADTPARTPWDVLGLTSEASWVEVTRRHKQLAKQHHPDRHLDSGPEAKHAAENRMSEINAAFSDLRRIYQLTGGT